MDKEAVKSYRILFGVALSVLLGGTVFFHFAEDFSWIDAFYFCVVTLTTVGYGDITPQTPLGKLFTSFYILLGVGIIAAFLSAFFKYRTDKFRERRSKNTK